MRSVVRVHCDPPVTSLVTTLHLDNCTARKDLNGKGQLQTEFFILERMKDEVVKQRKTIGLRTKSDEKIKLIRAQGGCQGTIRRRRTWQAAKSHGEPQAGNEPWISEWGNPAGVMSRHP